MSDSEDEMLDRQYKMALVGQPEVGKTSICNRCTTDFFSKQYQPTVGVDFYLKRIVLPGSRHVTLKMLDIGGSALQGSMLDKYIAGVDAILMVYDVTNYGSFEALAQWLQACVRLQAHPKKPIMAMVANKIDLEHLRTIKSDKHHKFAQAHGLLTYALSAKTTEGLSLCLQKVAAELTGIKLTKAEQEMQQTVVKAEIVTAAEQRLLTTSQGTVRTAVCCIQ